MNMSIRIVFSHVAASWKLIFAGTLSCVLVFGAAPGIVAAGTLKADVVRAAAGDAIKAYASANGLDIETAVPHARDMEFQLIEQPVVKVSLAAASISGRTCPLRLDILNARGDVVRRLHMTAHVRIFAQAVVATREIARGDSIGPGDMEMKRMEVGGLKEYYTDPEALSGARARTAIRAGSVLRKTVVMANPLVRKGDRVTLKAVAGSVEVTAQGIARSDGAKGDSIRVYNEMSRTTVHCTVIDSRTVRVGKGG